MDWLWLFDVEGVGFSPRVISPMQFKILNDRQKLDSRSQKEKAPLYQTNLRALTITVGLPTRTSEEFWKPFATSVKPSRSGGGWWKRKVKRNSKAIMRAPF